MNPLRNIKEMLSIPTGSRNVTTSGYSSFTDSQLFFGSQFWPENSQGASQDMCLSSRTSQQSSQEGSDPKFSTTYHTKPLLFGDLKDKTIAFGILDNFDKDRKKAKEKNDNDVLGKECQQIRETLKDIQQLITGTEQNTVTCQTVLEKFDSFASTLKNNLTRLQSDISQQFDTLLNKVISQKEVLEELEQRVKKDGDTTAKHGSNLQSLKNSLESFREEQERGQKMLEEAVKLLSTLVSQYSAKSSPERAMDSAIQTSPGLAESTSNILPDNKLESVSHNPECTQAKILPQDNRCIIGKRKLTPRSHRRRKKRPLVLSQRRSCVVDENSHPSLICNNKQNLSTSLCERHSLNAITNQSSLNPDCVITLNRELRSSETAGCLITPISCWSQDSNSPVYLTGIEPILENLSAESVTETAVKHENFWQLFDTSSDLGL